MYHINLSLSVFLSGYKKVYFNNIRSHDIDIALLIKYQTNLIILNQDIGLIFLFQFDIFPKSFYHIGNDDKVIG